MIFFFPTYLKYLISVFNFEGLEIICSASTIWNILLLAMVSVMTFYQIWEVFTFYILKTHMGTAVEMKELNRMITYKQFIWCYWNIFITLISTSWNKWIYLCETSISFHGIFFEKTVVSGHFQEAACSISLTSEMKQSQRWKLHKLCSTQQHFTAI